jgi:hypothetical protein
MDNAKLAENFHRQFASLKSASIKLKVVEAVGSGDKWTTACDRITDKNIRAWLNGAAQALNWEQQDILTHWLRFITLQALANAAC